MRRVTALATVVGLFAAAVPAALAGPENVSFPADYKTTFKIIDTRDFHLGGNTVAVIYANQIAIDSAKKGGALASGSVFLMETYRAKVDNGAPVLDDKGRMIKDSINGINMMERRTGWGKDYPAEWRNDEWEFATFTADGQRRTGNLQPCFECHKPVGDAGFDYAYAVGIMR